MATKRAPLVTVDTSDFKVEYDGETYYPHQGESVTFKRKITPKDMYVMAKASGVGDSGTDVAMFFHDDACEVLAHAIYEWNWTDPYTGEPLPQHPRADDLRDLDTSTEVQYLFNKWLETSSPGRNEGNEPKPSS